MKNYASLYFLFIIFFASVQLPAQDNEHQKWEIELTNQEAFTQQTSPNSFETEITDSFNPNLLANKHLFQSLSKAEQQTLEKHRFLITETQCVEMYELYEDNTIPFVTTDFIFHVYMVLLQDNLKEAEKYILSKELDLFLQETYNQLLKMGTTIPEREKEILKKAQVEIAASCQILNPKFVPADHLKDAVQEKIQAATTTFSQYIDPPSDTETTRGYRLAEITQPIPLKNYHLAVRYLSSAHHINDNSDIQTFLLIALAMRSNKNSLMAYNNYTDFTEALAGQKEDISLSFFLKKFPGYTVNDVFDDSFLEKVKGAISKEPIPVIVDDPSFGLGIKQNIRIIPPRVTLKNVIFDKIGKEDFFNQANLPDSGKFILSYFHFPANTTKRELAIFNPLYNELRQDHLANPYQFPSIYNHTLVTLSTLNLHPGPEHPSFQKSPHWKHKTMNTFLGGWTELEKTTSLYTKLNLYPRCTRGMDTQKKNNWGYVEPIPDFYKRLRLTVQNTQELFKGIGAFSKKSQMQDLPFKEYDYDRLKTALINLEEISRKELTNTPLNDTEIQFLTKFKDNAKSLCQRHNAPPSNRLEPSHKLCFLIHNRPEHKKAYSATGKPYCIYIVAPYGDRLQICKGAIYSYYEFTKPDSQTLKTKDWTSQSKLGYTSLGVTPMLHQKDMVSKQ